jgi:hypothetical protein
MRRIAIVILLFYNIIAAVKAQEVFVSSTLDTSRILIGDQIGYKIVVDKPTGLNLFMPVFKDTLSKNIEIISGPVIDSSNQGGRTKIIQKYIITSFDSGHYQIPPVFTEVKSKGGLKRFYSDYSLLEVIRTRITPADTSAKFFDIIKPYRAPVTLGEILPWVLLGIVVSAIIWLIIRYIKSHRKSRIGAEPEIVIEPAHIIAFRELETLYRDAVWQKGEIKMYYSRLTEILRKYLENRYNVYSLELTTSETLESLVKTGFKKDGSYNQLKEILTNADLVKFAKYTPDPTEHEIHFNNSWTFIQVTKEETENVLTTDGDKTEKEVKA